MRGLLCDEPGQVGIFWFFRGEIIADAVPLAEGEEYGDFVNGRSDHCSFWPRVQRSIAGAAAYEYDQVPRGRVIHRKRDRAYIVYGSAAFVADETQKQRVLSEFSLPADRTFFKFDEHYSPIPGMSG